MARDYIELAVSSSRDFSYANRFVYFALIVGEPVVKIGMTMNTAERITCLEREYSKQFEYIGFDFGGAKKESELHAFFSDYHLYRRDFFSYTDEIAEYVKHSTKPLHEVQLAVWHEWKAYCKELTIPAEYRYLMHRTPKLLDDWRVPRTN